MDIQQLRSSVAEKFPLFGPNKVQELVRLVFEIGRRDQLGFCDVLGSIPKDRVAFSSVKSFLERLRYPEAFARGIPVRESFAGLDIDPDAACDVSIQREIYPKEILIEKAVEGAALAQRMRQSFPKSRVEVIDRYKDLITGPRSSSASAIDFNRRCDQFFIVKEVYDHFKPCPCTPGVVSCGYHNANLGFGCPFECSYCFLQNYTNAPGIVFPANIEDLFSSFRSLTRRPVRVGSGETTDSLAFDHLTGFAPQVVEFFRSFPESRFEFKTKSDNIKGLLSVRGAANIVAAWSVNPQKIIDREEFFTASLARRLKAARACVEAGYRTAFHFDPVFYYTGWELDYADVVKSIFSVVPKESIAWISLGTLRMTVRQKKMIENRFPQNTILSAELITAQDGKVRYHDFVRENVYSVLLSLIREQAAGVPVYLCMETADLWRRLGIKLDPQWISR
ncbi:MAG: hypothetical protein HQL22_10845 [Candidatus Omnitrophica bacterium]|nr:hypothetical protein [Candidatus Omnitrophota bacterium]